MALALWRIAMTTPRGFATIPTRENPMNLHSVLITPIVSLLAGVLILIQPSMLNFIVAIYLILVGLIGLAPHFIH